MADANPDLAVELQRTRSLLEQEQRRSSGLAEELRHTKEHHLSVLNREKVDLENQLEVEQEFIVNKLMKRLEQLKQDKQKLANEVEFEEEYLVNNLQKRLQQLNSEKVNLESKLEVEQEYIVNKLQKKLEELSMEKSKLNLEKVDLENQLEAEQEYIVNKLQKQVEKLGREKRNLAKEKSELQRQVTDLAASVDKLNRDKIALENQMEMEEEGIVNRLQRQLEQLMSGYRLMEQKLETCGFSAKDLGPLAIDNNTEWVYGRSPKKADSMRFCGARRERPTSASSASASTLLPFRAASLGEAYPRSSFKKATSAPINLT
ncbi:hypothetical protein WJX72_001207 [[Myrmecia] bisecta]|uniref:Uncharacterized protein n=1 Tax=[Myrmecia] bisecta TaxID=41462 RepID=A0AAW1PWI8_9CHLO